MNDFCSQGTRLLVYILTTSMGYNNNTREGYEALTKEGMQVMRVGHLATNLSCRSTSYAGAIVIVNAARAIIAHVHARMAICSRVTGVD